MTVGLWLPLDSSGGTTTTPAEVLMSDEIPAEPLENDAQDDWLYEDT